MHAGLPEGARLSTSQPTCCVRARVLHSHSSRLQAQRGGAGQLWAPRLHDLQVRRGCALLLGSGSRSGRASQGWPWNCWQACAPRAPYPSLPLQLLPACCSAGAFPANRFTSYMTSSTSIDVCLARRELVRACVRTCHVHVHVHVPGGGAQRPQGVCAGWPAERPFFPPFHPCSAGHPGQPVCGRDEAGGWQQRWPAWERRRGCLGAAERQRSAHVTTRPRLSCPHSPTQCVFSMLNYFLPRRGVLPLNAGSNAAPDGSGVALFLGLSGEGGVGARVWWG